MIFRIIESQLADDFYKGKAILLWGARQVGKSTLLKYLVEKNPPALYMDADLPDVQTLLKDASPTTLSKVFQNHRLVVIDEAQQIANAGHLLKIITDHLPHIQVLASGSGAFELQNIMNEPLTGRKFEYQLFPLSWEEMKNHHGLAKEFQLLPHRLIYGSYPEAVNHYLEEERLLRLISESYLYKDVLIYKGLKKPDKMRDLIKALALQIGSQVNGHELGQIVGMKSDTVEDYLHLLERAFVIFRLPSFHTNQRKELTKSKKVYFYDNGIRNAVLNDYRPLALRQDKGALFENYIVSEMLKKDRHNGTYSNLYFWRTRDQQEIDLIIQKNGFLNAFEIKWSNKPITPPKTFAKQYPDHAFKLIHSENYFECL